jgi:DNA-binding FrmR family transcriptional regulator
MMQIAAVQQALSAFEEVIADLDALELVETSEAAA